MRPRDFEALGETTYDVLVVGGGIHGLATALDAAARGLTVALVEAGDFAAATSFNHQRTAHGGLRSLQSGRLGHARESIRERRALARIAPRLLRPLPFLIGTYRSVIKSRPALRAAFRHRSLAGPAQERRPRAGAAPAAAPPDLARGHAEAVSRRAPRRPDRRRQLVRLPDRPHQPAGDRVRRRRGGPRRPARELRRSGVGSQGSARPSPACACATSSPAPRPTCARASRSTPPARASATS